MIVDDVIDTVVIVIAAAVVAVASYCVMCIISRGTHCEGRAREWHVVAGMCACVTWCVQKSDTTSA